ncbi:3-deoxy-7-phosphoheptulonate synthase [Arenicella sp. 4NH20-0111]|uniref:3-deoxy-7-phosphoheptulonate synthase n=1 Tax=Arenicella sp. 4NH20-0111 TaxID=3127648 RepID=UPI0033418042
MMRQTDDTRIAQTKELVSPVIIHEQFPITEQASETTAKARDEIQQVMSGQDDRLVVVVGPCSIHDPKSAMEYAERLAKLKQELAQDLVIVMRVYFEKPRTTVGWKGLINDPDLNSSFSVNKGLGIARNLLLSINNLGVPAGCEYLDLITPQYTGDIVSWGAIGARTTESQCHRELASGLSCPVGFKNGTSGDLKIAVDAIGAASNPHHFLSVTKEGRTAIVESTGNRYTHIILRGGAGEPNYSREHVQQASAMLEKANLRANIMIDFSHANSYKTPSRQKEVCNDVCAQLETGEDRVFGVMIESHLIEGTQKVVEGQDLVYGQSITDGCIGWEQTEDLCRNLANAVRSRRSL